jgi:hypothetical protein
MLMQIGLSSSRIAIMLHHQPQASAVLLIVVLSGITRPLHADEPNEPRPATPPIPVSSLPEDERLAAIVEHVETNEALYKNLEARISSQYDIGSRDPFGPEIVRKDFTTHYVAQNGMFRLETQGTMFLSDGPSSRRDIIQMFDGEANRLVQRKESDPEESGAYEHEVIRPHTLLLRYASMTGSLSEYLRGGRPNWMRGMELRVSYWGAEEYQGLKCQAVRIAAFDQRPGSPASTISELWLAESRNFMPVRLRLFDPSRSAETPLVDGKVYKLLELKSGTWFPEKALVTSFSPLELKATGKQKLQWRERYSLSNLSLTPDYGPQFFQDDRMAPQDHPGLK